MKLAAIATHYPPDNMLQLVVQFLEIAGAHAELKNLVIFTACTHKQHRTPLEPKTAKTYTELATRYKSAHNAK